MAHRVLIISPRFPPINAADHQRVRMSLPYFTEFGWEPVVLTVQSDRVEGVCDPDLLKTVPENIPIQAVTALSPNLTRRLGLGDLGWRCLPYLRQMGDRLLASERFDLVYFSTTVFPTMTLGARWQKRFGVPYVLDFQDPWLNDYYDRTGVKPPGGSWKYGMAKFLAQRQEPAALRRVAHVISVSPDYPKILHRRYPWLRSDQFTVLPFGAPETDFQLLPSCQIRQTIFDPNDGKRHWVYVGRGGHDMALAVRSLFLAIQTARQHDPDQWHNVRLHFVGTSYAPTGQGEKTIEPIAREVGIADLVSESCDRIPYFAALQVLVASDAILMIGSNDPGYTASKLYPCVLARKPILAIFHQQSSVVDVLQRCQVGEAVTFHAATATMDLARAIVPQLHWLLTLPKGYQPLTQWAMFQPYTAREMTRQQCAIFDHCLEAKPAIVP